MRSGVFAAGVLWLFCACYSGPAEIPEDISAAELIQRAQEASDRNRYNQSLQYYQAIVDRFPLDIDNICAAEYEIAFIHYKQKQYDLAREELTALLSRYDSPDGELLPPQYKKLSVMVLKNIRAKSSGAATGAE
jgi:outer membrane protein assembly factor BamD (BamD/ComL family)